MSRSLVLISSYSYYNKEAANFGLGFNYTAGVVQWTLVTDNILSYMEYATANNMNISSSICFLFGNENRLPKYIRKQNRFHRKHSGGHGNASF